MLYFLRMFIKSFKLLEERVWITTAISVCCWILFCTEKFLHQSCCLLIVELEQIVLKIHFFYWSLEICLITSASPSWQIFMCSIAVTYFITFFLNLRPTFNSHYVFSVPLWFIVTTHTWDDPYIWERIPAPRLFNPLCWQHSMSSSWEMIIDYSGGKTPSQHQLAARPCPRAPKWVSSEILSRDSVPVHGADIIFMSKSLLGVCAFLNILEFVINKVSEWWIFQWLPQRAL